MKSRIANEQGLALVIALMLLVLLTVLGLAAISTTSTEIQLTANERTDTQAFQTTEAGIKEALYRLTLIPPGAANSLVSQGTGGSLVSVDGITIDASIVDPNSTKGLNPNPDWAVNIYFNATDPADTVNVINTRSILSNGSGDWGKLDYAGKPGDEAVKPPVTIRYMKEQDLLDMGLTGDLNGDGDFKDLIYYNGDKNNPLRLPSGTMTPGQADTAPPLNVNRNMVVMLAEAVGRYGNAKKKIQEEFTRYPLNPQANGALQTDLAVTVTGASFVSGFNHSEDTVPTDDTKVKTDFYSNNGCDNWSGGAGAGGCSAAYQGADKDPDLNCKQGVCTPEPAEYSGMTEADGHKPAVVTDSPFTAKGSMDAWGGDEANGKGWLDDKYTGGFPSLEKMLGLEEYPDVVQAMKDNANKDPNTCPSGFTYIDNAQSKQVYQPSKIPNCPKGSGIMVVTGDLDITSQFEFRGLIYVLGDASLGGGAWTLGSMAVRGATNGVKLAAGNPTVLYSKATVVREVMRAAMTNGAAFNILSWREVTVK